MKEKLLKWLRAAGVRALKTVAQTAVATIGTGAVLQRGGLADGAVGLHPRRGAVAAYQRRRIAGSGRSAR